MEIREYRTYNEQEILPLYTSVGWTAYTDAPDTLRQGFEHSLLTLAAYENGQLVGLIRTVGDGYTIVLYRISWCSRSIREEELERRYCKRCWTASAMCGRWNWPQMTRPKP